MHRPADTDYVHSPDDDCSSCYNLPPDQAAAARILGWCTGDRARLTPRQMRQLRELQAWKAAA